MSIVPWPKEICQGDEIIVTSSTGFRAAYLKRPNHRALIVCSERKPMTKSYLRKLGRQRMQRHVNWVGSRRPRVLEQV